MKYSLAALGLAGACVSCVTYPSDSERFSDVIVGTNRDPTAEFTAYTTFAIAPTVDFVDSSVENPTATPLEDSVANPLSEEVARQLTSRGYEEVDPNDDPTLGAKIAVIKGTVEGYTYAPVYGYSTFYWGYYYPYFVPVYYGYDTTFVRIDLIDVRNAVPATAGRDGSSDGVESPTQLPALWTAAVYGVLEDTVAAEVGQAVSGIDQAFEQSPYVVSQ